MTNEIQNLMSLLHCTEAEAIQILKDDEAIDKGKKLFELTDEQKQNSKKARMTGTRKVNKPIARQRKVDEQKKQILDSLSKTLVTLNVQNLEIITETQINFHFNNENYTIKLIKHR